MYKIYFIFLIICVATKRKTIFSNFFIYYNKYIISYLHISHHYSTTYPSTCNARKFTCRLFLSLKGNWILHFAYTVLFVCVLYLLLLPFPKWFNYDFTRVVSAYFQRIKWTHHTSKIIFKCVCIERGDWNLYVSQISWKNVWWREQNELREHLLE